MHVTRQRSERGFTLIELTIVMMLLTVIGTTVMVLFAGLQRDVSYQTAISGAERDAQPIVNDMVIRLRQATTKPGVVSGAPIEELSWDRIRFYADRQKQGVVAPGSPGYPYDGRPEQYTYELINCSLGAAAGGSCDLRLTIRPADAGTCCTYVNAATAISQRILLQNVQAAPNTSAAPTQALFTGFDSVYSGSPPKPTAINSCNPCTSPPLTNVMPRVTVHLRFDPLPKRPNPTNIDITEEVRLRND